MPGPVIYVAVAISAVAAVIVFKEFVYEPHFRPRFSAWKDSRQRRKARSHLHTSSASPSEGDDGSRLSQRSARGKKKPFRRSSESSDTSHIDLQHLIASEVESLKSGVEADGDNSGIRLRRLGESQKLRNRPVGNLNNARSLGTDSTQSLISLDGPSTSDEILTSGPKNRLSEPLDPTSPPPFSTGQNSTQAVQEGDASIFGGTPLPPDVRGPLNPRTPGLIGIPHIPETSGLSNPFTPAPMALGEAEYTRSSSPDTDFLSPSDILSGDQYLTPHDQTLSLERVHGVVSPTLSSNLSVEFLSSAPISPPGSPFVDAGIYFELVESRRGAVAQQSEIPGGAGPSSPLPGAVLFPVVRGDSEIFSLASQMSSDMSSDEGDYDYDSVLESELSNLTSDIADGERAAQH